jgi:hypothetical protein
MDGDHGAHEAHAAASLRSVFVENALVDRTEHARHLADMTFDLHSALTSVCRSAGAPSEGTFRQIANQRRENNKLL